MDKYLKRLLISCILVLAFGLCTIAYAGTTGNTMSNPVVASFGQTYHKSWTRDTDHLYHYNRIVLNEKGILKLTFSKPYDDDSEYGSLKFTVSDQEGEPIWQTDSRKSREKASPNYVNYICLDAGTYYVNVVPGFYVKSGTIDTSYSFELTPEQYIEVEPNESSSKATELMFGKFYTGYYGNDGGDFGQYDFFKFKLKKGSSYRIYIDNYDGLDATSCIMNFMAPNGDEINTYDWKVTGDGYRYIEFIAPASGYSYFQLENYSGLPVKYRVKIANAAKPAATYITYGANYSKTDVLRELSIQVNEKNNVAGYEIQYSTVKSKISKGKIKRASGEDNYCIDIKNVRPARKYYVRSRTYKTIDGVKKYSSWSKIKTLIY